MIKGSFIGNLIAKDKNVMMMISQMLKNQKKCWGNLWNEWVDHNRDAKWLKELQCEINVTKQVKVYIAKESLKEILGRMPNWKSPGPVLVWGILVKKFYQFPW